MREMIRLEDIYTAYEGSDKPVIRGISLSIDAGEYVIIGGPNGAGKTTLLESINGMAKVTHGKVTACGVDAIKNGNAARKKIGYVVQSFYFDPYTPFTVEQVVLMGRYGRLGLFKRPGREDEEKSQEAMHMLGIEDLAKKPIGTLSGGQQQRALIAQCIVKEPEVMMLDEPFSSLDCASRESITKLLQNLASKGIPVIMVSHAFDDLPDRTIRTIVMDKGLVVRDTRCSPGDVKRAVMAVAEAR